MYVVRSLSPAEHAELPDCGCGCLTVPAGAGLSLRGWLDAVVRADTTRLRDRVRAGDLPAGAHAAAHVLTAHGERHRIETRGHSAALDWLGARDDAVLVAASRALRTAGGGGLLVVCATAPGALPVLFVARHVVPDGDGGTDLRDVPRATADHMARSAARALDAVAATLERQ